MDRFKGDGSEGSAFDDGMFDLWLECVRQGRADIIRSRYGEAEKRAVCERFFMGDRAYALRVCMVLWVEAVKIAEKVGVPNTLVDAGFERCIHRSQDAGTPWRLVELSEDYLADLARIIGENTYVGEASPVFVKFHLFLKYIFANDIIPYLKFHRRQRTLFSVFLGGLSATGYCHCDCNCHCKHCCQIKSF